jgi:histone chaperone ASF1
VHFNFVPVVTKLSLEHFTELEWKLIYVGSAADVNLDQELDSVLVDPVLIGRNTFVFEAPAPNAEKVPDADLLGVTVMLLTCSYKDQEFIRIGYYVNNELEIVGVDAALTAEQLDEIRVKQVRGRIPDIRRQILNSENPQVTRFQINWGQEQEQNVAVGAPELQYPTNQEVEEEEDEADEGMGGDEGEDYEEGDDDNSLEDDADIDLGDEETIMS